MKYLILIGLIIVVVLEYVIISIGKQADEEADRMYKEWVKKHDRTDGADRPKTKSIKYFDDDEKVWKIGEVIVDD